MTKPRATDLAPETVNSEQDDEETQAQSVADEAIGRATSAFGLDDTEKVGEAADMPDLVDTMKQMESSGHIDMSAYRGERNDDDEEDGLGEDGVD